MRAVVASRTPARATRWRWASLLAGLAMNISEAGSEHSLGHALGALHHLPHGLTIGLMLAESIEHDRQSVPEIFERVADALGEPTGGPATGRGPCAACASWPRSTFRRCGSRVCATRMSEVLAVRCREAWTRSNRVRGHQNVGAYRAGLGIERR